MNRTLSLALQNEQLISQKEPRSVMILHDQMSNTNIDISNQHRRWVD